MSRSNSWRTKPYFIDSDSYNRMKGKCGDSMNCSQRIMAERLNGKLIAVGLDPSSRLMDECLNGNLIAIGLDPVTDEVFDCITDRPVQVQRRE